MPTVAMARLTNLKAVLLGVRIQLFLLRDHEAAEKLIGRGENAGLRLA